MAWITGKANASEIKILLARGWDIRDQLDRKIDMAAVKESIDIRVYVDNDVFRIMDGDTWDQASPVFRANTVFAELKRRWREKVLADECDLDFTAFSEQNLGAALNSAEYGGRIVGEAASCGKTVAFHNTWQALMHDLENFLSMAHVPEKGLPRYSVAPLAEAIKTKVTELELMLVSYKQEFKDDAVDNHEGSAGKPQSESGD